MRIGLLEKFAVTFTVKLMFFITDPEDIGIGNIGVATAFSLLVWLNFF